MRTDFGQEQISIAVVVPNYNHGRFLTESLSSIARQTRQPDEVVIIDDGSNDNSIEVVTSFLNEHPTWRLIRHPERRGAVKRLNEGAAEVRSDWISFFGADDLLDPSYLEVAQEMAALYPHAGMICGCVEVFGQPGGRRLRPPILPRSTSGYVSPDEFRELLQIGDNYFLGTATLYRRKVVMELDGFDEQLGSVCDGFLSRRIAARHGFGFIPEILGYWRIHGHNYSVSTATTPQALENSIRLMQASLTREPPGTFPPKYSAVLERRFLFAGARLIALDKKVSPHTRAARIALLIGARPFEQYMLKRLLAVGTPGAITLLTWLTIRLRPLFLPRLFAGMRKRRAILAAARLSVPPTV